MEKRRAPYARVKANHAIFQHAAIYKCQNQVWHSFKGRDNGSAQFQTFFRSVRERAYLIISNYKALRL